MTESESDPSAPGDARGGVMDPIKGVLLGALLHVIFQGGALWTAVAMESNDQYRELAALVPLMVWGLTQALYMVPAYFIAKRRGALGVAKGLAICAGVSFLLWGGCTSWMITIR